MQFTEALQWRYAAKNLNGHTVPIEKVNAILEAIRMAPTSNGLQPFKVIVVSNPELKGKIHEKACPQAQVVEGSHLLIFAAQTSLTAEHVDEYMARIAETRGTEIESLRGFSESIKGNLLSRTDEQFTNWSARQAYIALGFGLVSAAVEEVDACPMEGFNADAMDELLGLQDKNLKSVALMALGYRDAEKDFLAKAKKVRKSAETLFIIEA